MFDNIEYVYALNGNGKGKLRACAWKVPDANMYYVVMEDNSIFLDRFTRRPEEGTEKNALSSIDVTGSNVPPFYKELHSALKSAMENAVTCYVVSYDQYDEHEECWIENIEHHYRTLEEACGYSVNVHDNENIRNISIVEVSPWKGSR